MRLIDADALKKSIDECDICNICPDKDVRCDYDCDFPDFLSPKWEALIDAQPTIEPKRGEWEDIDNWWESNEEIHLFRCSVCGAEMNSPIEPNFCCSCGADMRKESE